MNELFDYETFEQEEFFIPTHRVYYTDWEGEHHAFEVMEYDAGHSLLYFSEENYKFDPESRSRSCDIWRVGKKRFWSHGDSISVYSWRIVPIK